MDESRCGHAEFEVPGEQPTGDTQSATGLVGVEWGQEVETQGVSCREAGPGGNWPGRPGPLPFRSSWCVCSGAAAARLTGHHGDRLAVLKMV